MPSAYAKSDFIYKLRERIAMRKTSSTLSAAESLQCIDRQLKQTANYGHISRTLKPTTQSSLNKVHVTTTERIVDPITGTITLRNTVEVIDNQAELEHRILERNKKHFAQAQRTPFTESPLKEMTPANISAYFDESGKPLDLPDGTFHETTTILELLRDACNQRPPSIKSTVSFENFVTSLLHWDEKTSTSPSGRHLGLYKSILTAHIDSGSEFTAMPDKSATTNSKATQILTAIHAVATCVAERGLYLDRWIFVINAMI
jgi:hypothetical protein